MGLGRGTNLGGVKINNVGDKNLKVIKIPNY